MIPIRELIAWAEAAAENGAGEVWVDDGGLTLATDTDAYFEIGGEPEDEA